MLRGQLTFTSPLHSLMAHSFGHLFGSTANAPHHIHITPQPSVSPYQINTFHVMITVNCGGGAKWPVKICVRCLVFALANSFGGVAFVVHTNTRQWLQSRLISVVASFIIGIEHFRGQVSSLDHTWLESELMIFLCYHELIMRRTIY
mgnify:CR=1 FL=1